MNDTKKLFGFLNIITVLLLLSAALCEFNTAAASQQKICPFRH